MKLFDWDAGDRYRVAFSTRLGGVSEGDFESLNLGILTDDDPERVVENRVLLCDAVGADPESATMAWQVHGNAVTEAQPHGIVKRTTFKRCDGLWTDRAGQTMMLLTADCYPVAIARTNRAPALCVLHIGWRGLLEGIVDSGVSTLGDGPMAAVVGPGIGPCCYEVGDEVAEPFRKRFGSDVVSDGRLDLAAATEQALREAGIGEISRTGHCTACEPELFFSHRRDQGRTGRQGIVAYVR